MKRILAILTVLLLAPPSVLRAVDAPAGPNEDTPAPLYVPPPNHVALYEQLLAQHSSTKRYKPQEMLGIGDVALRLARRGGTPHQQTLWRQQAVTWFDATLADPKLDLKDFHILLAFAQLAQHLNEDKLLTPQHRSRILPLAEGQLQAFLKSTDEGDYNIRLAQVLGYTYLAELVEDATLRMHAKEKIERYWSLIAKVGDLDEDAQNYDSFGAVFMVQLAGLLGHEDDLRQSANFRRLFERFRDIVSPSGLVPEYGDAYFSYTALLLDRIFLLEYAAQLYGDGSFRWAAQQLYTRPQIRLPDEDLWFRGLGLINLKLASADPQPPAGTPSTVTYRARRGSDSAIQDHLVDKLILRTGRNPGDAMVMLDLYASGSHSHPEKGPSICYYEAASVPLFHNMGRHHTRSAIDGNIAWALPGAERFPGCWNRENEWYTMRIPVEKLTKASDGYIIPAAFSVRNFNEQNRACRDLFFDNLRLEGLASVKLVDGFESLSGWDAHLTKITRLSVSDDKTQGDHSTRIDWKPVPSAEFKHALPQPIPQPFTRDQYSELKLDLKYTGSRPYAHIRGLGQQIDLGDQCLVSEIAAASAEQHGNDAFGTVMYRSYITPDTSLTRQMVLTAEGALVVHDVLTPGDTMKGWNAGQLWQLYRLKAKGDDWFCSDDDGAFPTRQGDSKPLRMVVRYCSDNTTHTDIDEVTQEYHCPNPRALPADHFFTTHSLRSVTPGKAERFTFVVVPNSPEADPAELARSVSFQTDSANTLTVAIGGIQVQLSQQAWAVRRSVK